LHEWAGLLGNEEAADLLEEILGEEKAANEKLTELARGSSNEEALGESGEEAKGPNDHGTANGGRAVRPTTTSRETPV
jgi:hypothetical protein